MYLSLYLIPALLGASMAQQDRLTPGSTMSPEVDGIQESDKGALDSIRDVLQQADIINEVVDDFIPQCFLAPYYGRKHRSVSLGNTLKPSKTQYRPSLKIYCPRFTNTTGLTIVLTDPDAPSRDDPKWSEYCHWIGKIPLPEDGMEERSEYLELSVGRKEGNDLIEYKPPGPPPKTGFHRYVFLLLQGDNSNLTAPEDRQNWGFGKQRHGVRDWAKKEGLEVVGANFFIAKNKKQK